MTNKKQCGTVLISPVVPIIGVIFLLIFGIILLISLCTGAGTGVCIILGIFCIMSLLMILTANQKIEYSQEGFTYRDIIRITHKYDYSQVKKIRYSTDVTIYAGHRIILIDSMADNGRKFARIAMQYSKNAEIITDRHSKLFNGNVKNPGEFIFTYILIAALPIGMAIWGLIEFKDIHPKDLTEYTGIISEYSFDTSNEDSKKLLICFDGFDRTLSTYLIDENSSAYESFQSDVSDEKTFQVSYLKHDNSDYEISIFRLKCGENSYISLEDINENYRETKLFILIFSAVMLVIWLIYCAVSSYVMCNADRYPKLVKLFVKPNYIVGKRGK